MSVDDRDADRNDDWHEPVDVQADAAEDTADEQQVRAMFAEALGPPPTTDSMTVDRREANGFFAEQATVYVTLPSGQYPAHVNAEGPRRAYDDEPVGPTVNWSAIGAVPVEDALVYAAAIIEACRIARTLTGPTEVE